jgi:hypothetical protein
VARAAVRDRARQVRVDAALQLVASGELSPEALASVVWPSPKLAITSARAVDDDRRHKYPDETKACALALIDAGASWSEAAREVGFGKSTVQGWVQRRPAEQHSGHFGPKRSRNQLWREAAQHGH